MFLSAVPQPIESIFPALGSVAGLKVNELSTPKDCYDLAFPLSKGKVGTVEQWDLGALGPEVEVVIRITRQKVYWLFPSFNLPFPTNIDTQVILLKLKNGQIAVLLPSTTSSYMGGFRGSSNESIVVRFERDSATEKAGATFGKVAVAFGAELRDVVAKVVLAARSIDSPASESGVQVKPYAEEKTIFSETLTYCTWNSLQPPIGATSTNALAALDSFAKNGIRPYSFLIDDAWQDTKNFRLQSFGCMPSFLDGLSDLGVLVKGAKEDFGVKQVGVWHTIQGYWCGVEPSKFIDKYKLVKVVKDGYPGPFEPEGYEYYIPHPDDVGRFFDDYYSIVASYGVSFTKVDNMASLDNLVSARTVLGLEPAESLGPAVPIPSLRTAYKGAIKAAAEKHFGSSESGRVIWCMGMTPRMILGAQVGEGSGPRSVLRNSDDYYPNEPDSHRYHIFINVVNAMFTSQLNLVPDLDMFQSHPYIRPQGEANETHTPLQSDIYPQAAFHAALRSLGAGPVTITDVPGKTDPAILNKLVGASKTGGTVALQASSSPFTSNDVFDPALLQGGSGRALRVFSKAAHGGGLLGYWNIRSEDGKVEDEVAIADVLHVAEQGSTQTSGVVLFSQKTKEVRIVHAVEAGGAVAPKLLVELGAFEFELVTVAPILSSAGVEVAVLGLVDKYNTLAGLASPGEVKDGALEVAVKSAGELAIWIGGLKEGSPPRVTVDGEEGKVTVKACETGSLLIVALEVSAKTDGNFVLRVTL
ncbi:hypothetical protein FRC04_008603 [Tulasnella sp. 424]|nr:hypothetical protein FRC04_008603 [Tulasnella sp. 424]KAG8965681.1 hypothetical protein FRC05_003069 [Tulasnella sp. 425]